MDKELDPFTTKMIFLRIGWMDRYQGLSGDDNISSGGAYVAQHGFGHEIFNFMPFQGKVYGYVQPPGNHEKWEDAKINITKLGASAEDESISRVLAVWLATSPSGGAFVVGWYKNATLYRNWQPAPSGSDRRYSEIDFGYYVTASVGDAFLIPPDERVFAIPQKGKGAYGQSSIWYADVPSYHRQLRINLLRYIEKRQLPSLPKGADSARRQPDPFLRQRVERIAVKTTMAHFKRLGYNVDSVEQDNIGWDLNSVLGKRHLRLEVKGLSGSQITVELTPNEYAAMKKYPESHRVCVVTNALTEHCMDIFAYSPDSGMWESSERRVLNIQEIISARCTATRLVRLQGDATLMVYNQIC